MAGNYLLDTCAWLDAFAAPQLLRREVKDLINQLGFIHLATISLLEVARKESAGQLTLGLPLADWFKLALPDTHARLLPITPEIASDATRLPGIFHKDPADQLIVATARIHGLTIVTSDDRILQYPHVSSVPSR